jgi:transcriptional regulator with XRE-family HTH domain
MNTIKIYAQLQKKCILFHERRVAMDEPLGARIRRVRIKYGMSQAELARRIHISLNAMNKIESGETPDPRASRIKAIAEVLRVTTDALFGRKDEESEKKPAAEALVGA